MKRIVLITVALALLASAPIHAAGPFPDVGEGDWFCPYVLQARDLGILTGYPDGTFRPSRQVTYGEYLAMAMRGRASGGSFTHWARPYYETAVSEDVIGEADFSARVLDDPIPRKDMALVMAGCLRNAGLGAVDVTSAAVLFSDVSASDPREYAIALCAHYGVLTGYPDGTFRPLGFLKRSEAAAAMTALDSVLKTQGKSGLQAGQTGQAAAGQTAQNPPKTAEKEPAAEPATRAELTAEDREGYYEKAGEPDVLKFMSDTARSYLRTALDSARFEDDGGLLVRFSWPDLPEGYAVKFDVQLQDADGTGLDGRVWLLRKGMEKAPTYEPSLKTAGSAEYRFAVRSLENVGFARILCVLTQEDGSRESSSCLYEQDLAAGACTAQYKVQTDAYSLSGTLPLEAPVFPWK
jgi:hypothetical protein